jgi:branched-chain amino acid transport system ATP-binding protein
VTLTVSSINKSYGKLEILKDVSLSVPAGARVGIIGPNGAGKSTLFAVIGGSVQPDSGSIVLEDKTLTDMRPQARAELGLVRTFQVARPFQHLTVRDNLMVAAANQYGQTLIGTLVGGARVRHEQDAIRARVEELLKFLKLDKVADNLAGRLSGGQRKLLELGRALMVKPSLILLDEPFAGVNPVLFGEISERIVELNQKGIGFLVIEHNIQALSRIVSEMYVLVQGSVLAHGAPDEVLAIQEVQHAYMGGAL